MDKQFKAQILAEVRAAVTATLEMSEEKWLTGDQLAEQFGCFSPSWIAHHGELLPRTQMIFEDKEGNEKRSRWCYPMHKINRMLADGSIKELSYRNNINN